MTYAKTVHQECAIGFSWMRDWWVSETSLSSFCEWATESSVFTRETLCCFWIICMVCFLQFVSLFCQNENENLYVANKDNSALLFNKNTYFSPFRFICKIYIFLKLRMCCEKWAPLLTYRMGDSHHFITYAMSHDKIL